MKRILAIWDFRTVVYSIGDLIHLIERMQIMLKIHNLEKFDFCMICNPNNPTRTPNHQKITSGNYHYQLPLLLSVIYSSPYIGNYFIFNDNKTFEKYLNENKDKYILCPTWKEYVNKEYAYAKTFGYIQKYFDKNKSIPLFELRNNSLREIWQFYKEKILPKFPVVVQLRNSDRGVKRNANLEEWLKFFNYCKKYDIIFIIIGRKNETKNIFRYCQNVLIAKDYFESIEYHLCLAYTSFMYLGMLSGPASLVFFSNTPYIIFNFIPAHEKVKKGNNFNFAKKYQKLIWQKENAKIIIKEFEYLYGKLNKLNWLTRIGKYD